VQQQLLESQTRVTQLTAQLKQQQQQQNSTTSSSSDLGDDLARVLISKEEVITQLERQLHEKERHVQQTSKQLGEEIAAAHKNQDALSAEAARSAQLAEHYAEQVAKCAQTLAQHELTINQLHNEKSKCEIELKSMQEYARNEMETLQEEVKTLEYKLVFSQRQAQEYQAVLEEMDAANANSLSQLGQVLASLGGDLSAVPSGSSGETSLRARLMRNLTAVGLLMQHVLENRNACVAELTQRIKNLQNELDECKEENVELNDHIYSVDVFMREKEAEAERFQKERDELEVELRAVLKSSVSDKTAVGDKNDASGHKSSYKKMLVALHEQLLDHTQSIGEFLYVLASLVQHLLGSHDIEETDGVIEAGLLTFVTHTLFNASNVACSGDFDLSKFRKLLASKFGGQSANLASTKSQLINARLSLKKLIKFLNSTELNQFNAQIMSYMAEQLIHKSALNGHLKFACELLRNKFESSSSSSSSSSSTATSAAAASAGDSSNEAVLSVTPSCSSSSAAAQFKLNINEQDEKIFKLASELLLSDEDSLRKLSTQVLNEAQHLGQLSCVLSTLRKFRWRHLSSNPSLDLVKKAYDGLRQCSELLNNSESDFEEIESAATASSELNAESSNSSVQLNYILEGLWFLIITYYFCFTNMVVWYIAREFGSLNEKIFGLNSNELNSNLAKSNIFSR
jgi:hypothetical protein